jgi:uncharacterized protein (TIGR02449 family)
MISLELQVRMTMEEMYSRLEARVTALIQQCESLQHANRKLKHDASQLIREKELLLAKHKSAVTQIENMVSRLKSVERPL